MPSSKAVLHDINTFGLSLNKAHNRITKDGRLVGYSQHEVDAVVEEMIKDPETFLAHAPTLEAAFETAHTVENYAVTQPVTEVYVNQPVTAEQTFSPFVTVSADTIDTASVEPVPSSLAAEQPTTNVETKRTSVEPVLDEIKEEKVEVKPKKSTRRSTEKPVS